MFFCLPDMLIILVSFILVSFIFYGIYLIFLLNVVLSFNVLIYQMSPFEGAPEEFDQTIFAVRKDRTIGPVEGRALNFVRGQQRYSFMTLW